MAAGRRAPGSCQGGNRAAGGGHRHAMAHQWLVSPSATHWSAVDQVTFDVLNLGYRSKPGHQQSTGVYVRRSKNEG
jgi:hypothetical protein